MDLRIVTTDRRQFTLFYLFHFSFFFWYFICMSAFLVRTSGHMMIVM